MPIVGHFEFNRVKKFPGASSPENHILFYSNGLAIYHGLPNIGHIKVNKGQ